MKKIHLPDRLFDGEKFCQNTGILSEEGKITAVLPEAELPKDDNIEILRLPGKTLAPAYKDIQIYGGNGQMFSLFPSIDSLKATYEYSLAGGTTAFMATLPTSTPEIMYKAMDAVADYWQQGLPGLLGLHLEGPYLNPLKKGAHIEEYIQKPTLDMVKALIERGNGTVKMMTVAPECCSKKIIHYLLDQEIVVSAGHSNATYEEARRGFDWGITTCTHLFNAMSPFQHRAPGLVGAIFDSTVYSSIIPDGIHVQDPAFRIAAGLMDDRLFFITDAITEAQTDSYSYILKKDRYVTEKGTLAGSCLTLGHAVARSISDTGLSPEAVLQKASVIPVKVIGKEQKWGKIATGFEVDWVVLNRNYKVTETITKKAGNK